MTFILLVFIGAALEIAYNPSESIWISMLLFIAIDFIVQFFSLCTEIVTVKSKKIKKVGFFKLKHRVINTTDGCELFNVNDDAFLKFNARKIQSKIKVGKTYQVKMYRIALSGKYNILSVREVRPVVRKKSGKKSK